MSLLIDSFQFCLDLGCGALHCIPTFPYAQSRPSWPRSAHGSRQLRRSSPSLDRISPRTAQVRPNLAPEPPMDRDNLAPEPPKSTQLGPIQPRPGPTWSHLGPIRDELEVSRPGQTSRKPIKTNEFLLFETLGGPRHGRPGFTCPLVRGIPS